MTHKNSAIMLASAVAIILGCYLPLRADIPRSARARTDLLEIETLLSDLGYWILKVDGVADASTKHAITAFQKVEGRKRTGTLSPADRERLRVRPSSGSEISDGCCARRDRSYASGVIPHGQFRSDRANSADFKRE